MCSIQVKQERFTILLRTLIVPSQAHTTVLALVSMEVATLAGSAEDSLADRAAVVVEDPAVADSNEGEFMLNEMMHRPVVKPELVEYMRTSQRRFPGG